MSPLTACLQKSFLPKANVAAVSLRSAQPRAAKGAINTALSVLVLLLLAALAGCGAGGYFGAGAIKLSASAVTIDAGQAFPVTSTFAGTSTISWALSGSSCTGNSCGTLASTGGAANTYTAPAGLSTQMKVNLTASIAGTADAATLAITVNPDPVISGTPPAGTVGTPYSTTLSVAGGTSPLTLSLASGTPPPGLTFNAATGILSGTPTATGTFTFNVQAVDSSALPFTVSAAETVVVTNAAVQLSLSGNPPAGTVGATYATTLQATGGTAPYSFSLVSGSLPAGLVLAPASGVISGTPTTSGTSVFTAQVQDAKGVKATGVFSISVTSAQGTLSLTTSTLPNGTVGVPYSATIGVTGGTAPYACVFTAGTLPAGLTLSGCVVSGTPTAAGTSNLMVKATDSSSPAASANGPESITIAPAPLAITTGTLPNGTVAVPYNAIIGVSGGTSPYSCSITSGTLPAGLALGANCLVSGTPTTPGTSSLVVKATDASNPALTTSGPVSITIAPAALAITTGTLPNGTVGVVYSSTIGVSGGTSPYTCSITSGTLPAGLALGANCLVSGTPTTAGTSNLMVKATDSSNPTLTASGPVAITIAAAPALVIASPPSGTVGVVYNGTIPVTGGNGPYTCKLTSGTLPNGLSLSGCVIAGTPTSSGAATLTVQATDSSTPPTVNSGPVTLTINPAPLAITTGTLPSGTVGVAYSSPIGVNGGTSPYACTITSGTLQTGLTLGANCLVSGTPTVAGTANLIVKATDAGNPALTTSGPVALTINPAVTITLGNPPPATVGTPYTGPIPITGGTGPYTCHLISGTLPGGLTLNNCTLTGTPITSGPVTVQVGVTDSGNPPTNGSGPVTLTINPAPLAITTGTLASGTVGVAYSSTIGVTGGTSPYACTITSGTLQTGLTLGANCLVSGTPTVAGTANLIVKATDAGNPALTTSGPVALTINPAVLITLSNPPAGTVGMVYNNPIPITGGTGPYTCHLVSGTLPSGLSLNNCTLTGTPTTPGPVTVQVGVTDSSNPPATASGAVTITINNPAPTLSLGNPPNATVGTPYNAPIPVTGGTGPYTCTLNSGVVPAGLTLTNCNLAGTPTTPVTATLNITATDSSSPVGTTTSPVVVTVQPIPALTFSGSLPNAVIGVPYTQTLHATGGVAPYTYALTAGSGALPPGITLSTTGVVSGTPTTPGAFSLNVTATDAEATPQTASLPLILLVTYPPTITDAELTGPYAFLFQGYDDVAAGLLAYQTATVGSFTANGAGVISNGELDSNHQGSNPVGATIASNNFLGTYTLGTDNRGFLTITTLNPDGTAGRTNTYAISVKAPVAPATTSAQGSLIEFDSNQLAGTKGSGTFLQQTAASFPTGLTGSYAFGLSGDTPCLPTCTVGIIAGPAASVGEFTVNAGALTGTSDANIATTTFAAQPVAGSYGSADGNGRLPLTLNTAGTPAGIYPSDYALYMVDANHAFILSTDKHSAAILLAGSAQSQTIAPFANTALNGPFIGYENAASNPGLVGTTLANTANLSTATIFRQTGNGLGTCTTTNVDTGGTTQLVNQLTGLGSGAPILNALLGTYQSTGTAACNVAGNGRTLLNYPAPNTALTAALTLLGLPTVAPPTRVAYLAGANRGYFLETGYAGLGQIEPQTGANYSVATFNGTYVYGETPASSVATTNASGFITANGNGTATSTEDLNVGVGTINVLTLGVGHNDTYTTPDQTTGRFLFNDNTVVDTSVIYVISPGRFVLLDTNPLTTSPSVAVLY